MMTEAQAMVQKIEAHRATGGRVFSTGYGSAKEIGEAWAEEASLMVRMGRSSKPVCIPANYVTADLRREYRNVVFR